MSPRSSSAKRQKMQANRRRGLDSIQIVGIGIAGVVLLGLLYLLGSRFLNQNPCLTTQANPQQWSSPPAMALDPGKQYFANVKMLHDGSFVIQLYPDKAPITVNNFVFLARHGFYNCVSFHRVIDGFMAQGGDPTGTGMGGPGYQFPNELNDLAFDKPGVVAMANSGPNTNGSQFFITFGPYGLSESSYTIFGQVISGMDVVNKITRRDPQTNPNYLGDFMESVTITEK